MRGRVQGVGFRYATVAAAQRHGVTGFVRNLPDGSVQAEVEGAADDVEAMLAFLRAGPPAAAVVGVDVSEIPERGDTEFTEARTPPATR